jgi:hypothetical protein
MQCHLIFIMRLIFSKPHIDELARSTHWQATNFFVSFRLMKECIASLSTHETFLPLILALRYKKLGLGARLLALPQNQCLTFK